MTIKIEGSTESVLWDLMLGEERTAGQIVKSALALYQLYKAGKVNVENDSPGCGVIE